jgi:hypothetical protein
MVGEQVLKNAYFCRRFCELRRLLQNEARLGYVTRDMDQFISNPTSLSNTNLRFFPVSVKPFHGTKTRLT